MADAPAASAPAPAAAPAAAPAPVVAPAAPVAASPAAAPAAAPVAAAPAAAAPAAGDSPAAAPAADPNAPKPGDPKPAAKPGDAPAGAPEKYADFKLPDGVTADAHALNEFLPVAKELNLSQEQAQKVLDVYTTKVLPAFAKAQEAAIGAIGEDWKKQALTDKELGGDKFNENIEIAKSAVTKFGTPELVKVLNETRLGNHPEVIRLLHRIGKAISEDTLTAPAGGGGDQKSLADKLYPPKPA